MHHAVLVAVVHRREHLVRERRLRALAQLGVALEVAHHRATRAERHHEGHRRLLAAALHEYVEHARNVRVVERALYAHVVEQRRERLLAVLNRRVGQHRLQRVELTGRALDDGRDGAVRARPERPGATRVVQLVEQRHLAKVRVGIRRGRGGQSAHARHVRVLAVGRAVRGADHRGHDRGRLHRAHGPGRISGGRFDGGRRVGGRRVLGRHVGGRRFGGRRFGGRRVGCRRFAGSRLVGRRFGGTWFVVWRDGGTRNVIIGGGRRVGDKWRRGSLRCINVGRCCFGSRWRLVQLLRDLPLQLLSKPAQVHGLERIFLLCLQSGGGHGRRRRQEALFLLVVPSCIFPLVRFRQAKDVRSKQFRVRQRRKPRD